MPFIRTIPPKEATGKLKEVYGQDGVAEQARAPVTQIFSIRPDLLEDFGKTGLAHFWSPTPLSPKLRQLLAVTVSKENACPFCFESHSMMLQALGFPRSSYRELVEDPESARLDELTRTLSRFARKATADVRGVTPSDIEEVRAALRDEGNYVEAVFTVAVFNWINRIVNALGVSVTDLDPAIKSVVTAYHIGLGRLHPFTPFLGRLLRPKAGISAPEPGETLRQVESLYRGQLGFTHSPPFYRAMMIRPIQMKAWADKARRYLTEGMLPLEVKMSIARVAAEEDGYDWLLGEALGWLEDRNVRLTPGEPPEVGSDRPLPPWLQDVLRLARDVSASSFKITERRIDELRGKGLKDEEILEAVCVASFFDGESRLYRCLT